MFHSDGHCATDQETVYVQVAVNLSNCPAAATTSAGSSTLPFCQISDALAAAGTRSLLVLRGASIPGGTNITNGSPLSLIGQSAVISAGPGQAGLHVTGTDVYVRSIAIGRTTGVAATTGIIADSNATVQIDGVDIEGMPQGGLLVTGGAGYDVINSIFASNGGTRDSQNRLIGGVWIDMPPSGQKARFAFNTIVSNSQAGIECSDPSQVLDASLLAQNLSGAEDYLTCTLATTSKAFGTADPMLTSTFRAKATSPCVDFVKTPPSGAPDHDIDAVTRPQGQYFDCGASEFKAP
jgi:hypothetical protein